MRLLMAFQKELIREFFLANITRVHLTSVCAFMVIQTAHLRKRPIAKLTLKWLLPGVHTQVCFQISPLRECLVTVLALERPLPSMCAFMVAEKELVQKGFFAVATVKHVTCV